MSKQTKKATTKAKPANTTDYKFPKDIYKARQYMDELQCKIEGMAESRKNNALLKELSKLDTTTVVNIALACPEYAKQQEMKKQLAPLRKELKALREHCKELEKKEQEKAQESYHKQNCLTVNRAIGQFYGRKDISFEELWPLMKRNFIYYGVGTDIEKFKEWKEKTLARKAKKKT